MRTLNGPSLSNESLYDSSHLTLCNEIIVRSDVSNYMTQCYCVVHIIIPMTYY